MKTKKIEWKETINGLHGVLPMQLNTVLRKREGLWYWSIMRSAMSIVSYFAKSEEQAKADCQRAWEEMLMPAFEKREGCACGEQKYKFSKPFTAEQESAILKKATKF